MGMFNEMSCLLYDLVDAKRTWMRYVANIKLIHIPSAAAYCTVPAEPAVVAGECLIDTSINLYLLQVNMFLL